ncbi:type II toxin-antitoxin system death-on-curing family toxin [Candidatus Wolfebacteria bacterium]|nr:type II toxin-antitoxin system death-on-curing family toxin [Candidatus Wolfebacteria bacterium]
MTEPKEINYIDLELMEKMCHPLAVALFDSGIDPITHFSKHNKARLESALSNPKWSFYPTFTQKAAILYYGLVKGHCFENGNKRTATAALLVFLHINNFWIDGRKREIEDYLVDLAKRVASSEGNRQMSDFLAEIDEWLNKHINVI